jgi:hypothetical protein
MMPIDQRLKLLDFMDSLPATLDCKKCKRILPKELIGAKIYRKGGRIELIDRQSYCQECRAVATKQTQAKDKARRAKYAPVKPKPRITVPISEALKPPKPLVDWDSLNIPPTDKKVRIIDLVTLPPADPP